MGPVRPCQAFSYNHASKKANSLVHATIRHVPEGRNWRDTPFDLLPAGTKRARPTDHTKRSGRLSKQGLCGTTLTKCDPH